MTKLIERLSDRMLSTVVPQVEAEALMCECAGPCLDRPGWNHKYCMVSGIWRYWGCNC
ncbi:hypothetical protein [Nonomuraea longicatena]|uniref:Uncharacterized protein n=1 Tax=Nonomuraea longicatena TaxID=83682 RepID=A0ABP4A167_9ACTN